MQTHYDENHRSEFMELLRERANLAAKAKAATITAGNGVEQEICSWTGKNGVQCRQLPPDEQDILRISIGGGEGLPISLDYAVIRGDVGKCITLLQKALAALRECPE